MKELENLNAKDRVMCDIIHHKTLFIGFREIVWIILLELLVQEKTI